MSKSRAELVSRVLENLGVLASGQTPAAEDTEGVDQYVGPAIAELNALDICNVQDAGTIGPSGGAIDEAMFLALADYIANACGPKFGLANDPALYVLSTRAVTHLRTVTRPERVRKMLQTDAQLRSRRWPVGSGNFTNGT